jgi:heavy metal efflux system protein
VAFTALNIEAYPDPAPPIIEIIAQRPGQSPEEMERYVTIPIEIAIAGTPGLKYIRSNTVYALSFIRLQFEYGRDYHFVRQQTINRLREADLPQGVQPVISPAGTISEIFRYELKGPPGMDVLRELENISVGHGVSLLCWRSGGVEHPHDTPPYPFTPSPTFAHSSS